MGFVYLDADLIEDEEDEVLLSLAETLNGRWVALSVVVLFLLNSVGNTPSVCALWSAHLLIVRISPLVGLLNWWEGLLMRLRCWFLWSPSAMQKNLLSERRFSSALPVCSYCTC